MNKMKDRCMVSEKKGRNANTTNNQQTNKKEKGQTNKHTNREEE